MAGLDLQGSLLDWCLAALTVALWSSIYAIYVWRDQDLRRWLRRTIATRRFLPVRRARDVGPDPIGPSIHWPRPNQRPRTSASGTASGSATTTMTRSTSSALRITAEPAPAATDRPTLSVWRANHLPLRYRLLGQVRRASNDN